MPEISVIMTVFNGAPFLGESVRSVLNQTFKDFEFIIVDNASTDNSVSIIESFHDQRIRLTINGQNLGQTKALNIALSLAQGKFIARMDADDISLPARFEKQRTYLLEHPAAGLVGSWHEEIDRQGRPLKIMRYPTDPKLIHCHLLSDGNLTRRCLSHPTAFFRRETILMSGGYDETVKFAQDYDLWTRISQKHEIHNVGEVLFRYRSTPHSVSRQNAALMDQELDMIIRRNIERIWPGILERTETDLLRMLRNRPPLPATDLNSIFSAFDEYFDRATRCRPEWENLNGYREQIKFYYLPRLATRWPMLTIRIFMQNLANHPSRLLDDKFQKNIFKVMSGA